VIHSSGRQNTRYKSRKIKTATAQRQVSIKMISVHEPPTIQRLKEILTAKKPLIVITRISQMASRNSLVNEIYSECTKKSYSIFRLGEDRLMVIPNDVQVKNGFNR
jgi:SepF-like predicted cell division protein (DUF552 family)